MDNKTVEDLMYELARRNQKPLSEAVEDIRQRKEQNKATIESKGKNVGKMRDDIVATVNTLSSSMCNNEIEQQKAALAYIETLFQYFDCYKGFDISDTIRQYQKTNNLRYTDDDLRLISEAKDTIKTILIEEGFARQDENASFHIKLTQKGRDKKEEINAINVIHMDKLTHDIMEVINDNRDNPAEDIYKVFETDLRFVGKTIQINKIVANLEFSRNIGRTVSNENGVRVVKMFLSSENQKAFDKEKDDKKTTIPFGEWARDNQEPEWMKDVRKFHNEMEQLRLNEPKARKAEPNITQTHNHYHAPVNITDIKANDIIGSTISQRDLDFSQDVPVQNPIQSDIKEMPKNQIKSVGKRTWILISENKLISTLIGTAIITLAGYLIKHFHLF